MIHPSTCIVRNTAARKGRTRTVAPGASAARQLHYGRIILDGGETLARFGTRDLETAFIPLHGAATVRVDDASFDLGRYDALYAPRDSTIEIVASKDGCDIAEIAAPVTARHPVQHVPFGVVEKDPKLHFETGVAGARREVNVLVGANVKAGRILAGVTFSQPGHWTSWPPHEHAAMLEEAYLYFDMPAPAFGIQLVYTNAREPELMTVVHDGDVVLMPEGYHPNVAAPGYPINFMWMMAAHREDVDRQFGVVNVQPEYTTLGSGLDAARRK